MLLALAKLALWEGVAKSTDKTIFNENASHVLFSDYERYCHNKPILYDMNGYKQHVSVVQIKIGLCFRYYLLTTRLFSFRLGT